MKKLNYLFIVLFIALSNQSFAEQVVVVHPDNNSEINLRTLKRIFLGKLNKFPGGETAVPVNQAEGTASRDEFNELVLDKSASQLKSYWSKLVFTGKGNPPLDVESDAEIKELVSSNPNMIGYIDASLVDDTVKVVYSL